MQALESDRLQEEQRIAITAEDYAAGIDTYLADAAREHILRPHQDNIFGDLQGFLREGGRKGYVTAPTGTGKTVIFVELSKALLAAEEVAGRKPRILVVEPTKDLVHQTLGRTGKKGYGEFAPGLQVASFFSDSTESDREYMDEADVVVTTYDSLAIMTRREETRDISDEEKEAELPKILAEVIADKVPGTPVLTHQLQQLDFRIKNMSKVGTGQKMFDPFDVIILDEAHHVLGGTASSIVDNIGPEKLVIGFTATPNANEKKRLDNHLPSQIHDLTFKEAISMELLAPLASAGLRTHMRVQGSDMFDSEGDYLEGKLSYLANSASRNSLITHAAKTLVEHGFGTIIPCIAGSEAAHAVLIANQLNAMGVTAAAIHGGVPSGKRKEFYRQFENGEIDALTFIRILGEGWDSTRAKAIVEASPTRSQIIKRQRIGRVLRPGDVALVLDIIDDYDPFNPPLHLADLMDSETVASGETYGTVSEDQRERITNVLEALEQNADVADEIPADYTKLAATLSEYQKIVGGRVSAHRPGHFSIPEKISPLYAGLNDEIIVKLWKMKRQEPDAVLGRQGYSIRALYEVGKCLQLLREVPECERDRAFVLEEQRWMSTEGFVIGFSNKYPEVDAGLIEDMLNELGDISAWQPLKAPVPRDATTSRSKIEYEIFKAYRADKYTIAALDKQLQEYFGPAEDHESAENIA